MIRSKSASCMALNPLVSQWLNIILGFLLMSSTIDTMKVNPQRMKNGVALLPQPLRLSVCSLRVGGSRYAHRLLWAPLWSYRPGCLLGRDPNQGSSMGLKEPQQDCSHRANRLISWSTRLRMTTPTMRLLPTRCWPRSTRLLTMRVGCSPVNLLTRTVFDNFVCVYGPSKR